LDFLQGVFPAYTMPPKILDELSAPKMSDAQLNDAPNQNDKLDARVKPSPTGVTPRMAFRPIESSTAAIEDVIDEDRVFRRTSSLITNLKILPRSSTNPSSRPQSMHIDGNSLADRRHSQVIERLAALEGTTARIEETLLSIQSMLAQGNPKGPPEVS
jgi:hypothetical protein